MAPDDDADGDQYDEDDALFVPGSAPDAGAGTVWWGSVGVTGGAHGGADPGADDIVPGSAAGEAVLVVVVAKFPCLEGESRALGVVRMAHHQCHQLRVGMVVCVADSKVTTGLIGEILVVGEAVVDTMVVGAREDLVVGVVHGGTDQVVVGVDVTELFTFHGLLSVSLALLSLVYARFAKEKLCIYCSFMPMKYRLRHLRAAVHIPCSFFQTSHMRRVHIPLRFLIPLQRWESKGRARIAWHSYKLGLQSSRNVSTKSVSPRIIFSGIQPTGIPHVCFFLFSVIYRLC